MSRSPHLDPARGGKRAATGLDRAIATLAARQHGVVARSQLLRLGFGRHAIDHRIGTGRLHPLHRGVYAVGHPVVSREGRFTAATLIAEGAALSHRSAAALWGMLGTGGRSADITVPRHLRPRAGIHVHEGRLPPDETTTHHGIPVTTPARTLLDLAAVVPPHHLERAATEAEIRRLTSPTSLADLVARHPSRPGTRALRRLLARRAIGRTITKRELEACFLALLDAHAIPRPRTNVIVDLDPKPAEVDCLWPAHRLVAELDGFATHGTRTAFEADRERDRALLLAGYRVTRITWRQVTEDNTALARALKRLLDTNAPPPGG